MWFQVNDQPLFAVAGFWQHTKEGAGFAMVTCDPNALVAPIHPKAMITIRQVDDHADSLEEVLALQKPYNDQAMTAGGPTFPTRDAVDNLV